jgi:hypothetical protein
MAIFQKAMSKDPVVEQFRAAFDARSLAVRLQPPLRL